VGVVVRVAIIVAAGSRPFGVIRFLFAQPSTRRTTAQHPIVQLFRAWFAYSLSAEPRHVLAFRVREIVRTM
jgi:hypothetical protein